MFDELTNNFPNALMFADLKYFREKAEKSDSWKEMTLADLYSKKKKHNIQLYALIKSGADFRTIAKEATNVLLYTFMITERTVMLLHEEHKM